MKLSRSEIAHFAKRAEGRGLLSDEPREVSSFAELVEARRVRVERPRD